MLEGLDSERGKKRIMKMEQMKKKKKKKTKKRVLEASAKQVLPLSFS